MAEPLWRTWEMRPKAVAAELIPVLGVGLEKVRV